MAKLTDKVSCPHCGHKQSKIINTRPTTIDVRLVETWRRRACTGCGQRFTTLATERTMVDTHTVAFNIKFSAIHSTRVRLGS